MGLIQLNLWSQNLLLKASADGWLVKIVDFGLSNTHEVHTYMHIYVVYQRYVCAADIIEYYFVFCVFVCVGK